MRKFFSFVLKETKHILRDKRTMLILFGMPVTLMLLFGFAISTDVRDVRTIVVSSSIDHQTRKVVDAIIASEYFDITHVVASPSDAERLMRNQKADIAIVFSENFANKHGCIQLITDAADPNMAQMYTAYITQIIMQAIAGDSASHPLVNTKMLYNPQSKSAYNFVPGIMGMLLMLICAMMTSISIVREKEKGTMEVLLVSPIKPIAIIVAKAVPYMLLALIILATILLLSRFVLGVPIAGSLFWIVVVSLIYILLALSLGLLISNVAKTQLVALLMSAMILLMPVVMLSGMLFPVESMPTILRYLAAIVPPRYYIQAMRKLMIMGVGVESVMKEIGILTGMTIFLLSLALAKFNKMLDV